MKKPNSAFRNWVRSFGVARLARVVSAPRKVVKSWLSDARPAREHAELIVAISGLVQYRCPDGAPLRLQDVRP